jgi:hypothetical protein
MARDRINRVLFVSLGPRISIVSFLRQHSCFDLSLLTLGLDHGWGRVSD